MVRRNLKIIKYDPGLIIKASDMLHTLFLRCLATKRTSTRFLSGLLTFYFWLMGFIYCFWIGIEVNWFLSPILFFIYTGCFCFYSKESKWVYIWMTKYVCGKMRRELWTCCFEFLHFCWVMLLQVHLVMRSWHIQMVSTQTVIAEVRVKYYPFLLNIQHG